MRCRTPKEANMHLSLSLSSLIGAVGTVLAFLTVVPQARKLQQTTSAAGVSIAGLANSIVSGFGWTYFGLVQHDIWVALPAAVTVPPAMYASLRAYGGGGNRERLWLPLLWAAVVATSAVSGRWLGDGPLTLTLGFSIAFMIGPAAWTVWTSADLTAVSKSAWYWLIAEAGLTGTYGYLAKVDANLLYAAVAIAGSLFILGRVAAADRTGEDVVAIPVSRGWESYADAGSPGTGDGEGVTRTPSGKISSPSLDLIAHQA
jgi:uncharacterized protein with PQ loop repeat